MLPGETDTLVAYLTATYRALISTGRPSEYAGSGAARRERSRHGFLRQLSPGGCRFRRHLNPKASGKQPSGKCGPSARAFRSARRNKFSITSLRARARSRRAKNAKHQLTALSQFRNLKRIDEEFGLTNRLRTEGTESHPGRTEPGARRVAAQSYAGWPNKPEGGPVKTEDDPLDPTPPESMKRTLAAIRQLESTVSGSAGNLEGLILRYGALYGQGTQISPGGEIVELVRKRQFPIFGNGDRKCGPLFILRTRPMRRALPLKVDLPDLQHR